jgi:hypothetical protein
MILVPFSEQPVENYRPSYNQAVSPDPRPPSELPPPAFSGGAAFQRCD